MRGALAAGAVRRRRHPVANCLHLSRVGRRLAAAEAGEEAEEEAGKGQPSSAVPCLDRDALARADESGVQGDPPSRQVAKRNARTYQESGWRLWSLVCKQLSPHQRTRIVTGDLERGAHWAAG